MNAVPTLPAQTLVAELRARATALGFDSFGIAAADARPDLPAKLDAALAAGWHGDMDWMAETAERRASPNGMWPEAKSVILLGINYGPETDPLAILGEKSLGSISVYARNRDYHEIIKGKLKEIAGLLARRTAAEVKVFVDTAPLMEKPLAEAAGLGWQGKHTVLVSREFGSWLFLGAILTSADLPADAPHAESCGSCTRCLDICPTNAFPAPFQLDARRCLAYLTVEHKGPIPVEFRAPMGNRIYGCDDCLAVCPWNKFASISREARLRARPELERPALAELVQLDDARFRALFAGSPIKRIGLARFLRNVLIAIGNSDNATLIPLVEARLDAEDALVRGAAVWALRRLAPARAAELSLAYRARESDSSVMGEWTGDIA
ncbi:MAG: tRNA epoxyqueuosine(34) reductase QueG [Alphaproteobacteria bacterium]|nr:tRNA epoxyqueuosine(34) reductase QueG [Alphaproteobacteria bacterium]MBU1562338.1 tRNA epoxyqueuosine(34) reductase QueG [Alphaproteobacteria bacterium]MBU2302690.1 tRNA epoxyqueuosine(34) reductase QueG [Alphaproteobacteria bacterium]MBU2369259.1 tRNA epoxyqueuosine(34) reductase QueG [Alphaproteobacteria bacterium]